MLLILNLPLVGLWVKLLTIPYRYLFPAIMVFCSIGVYSINSGTFEVYEAACSACSATADQAATAGGAAAARIGAGAAIEENFRRAMVLSRGDVSVLFTSPLSASLLAAAAIAVILIMLPPSARGERRRCRSESRRLACRTESNARYRPADRRVVLP
jgi:TctA family transporter